MDKYSESEKEKLRLLGIINDLEEASKDKSIE